MLEATCVAQSSLICDPPSILVQVFQLTRLAAHTDLRRRSSASWAVGLKESDPQLAGLGISCLLMHRKLRVGVVSTVVGVLL